MEYGGAGWISMQWTQQFITRHHYNMSCRDCRDLLNTGDNMKPSYHVYTIILITAHNMLYISHNVNDDCQSLQDMTLHQILPTNTYIPDHSIELEVYHKHITYIYSPDQREPVLPYDLHQREMRRGSWLADRWPLSYSSQAVIVFCCNSV